jgi:hypothetical protein
MRPTAKPNQQGEKDMRRLRRSIESIVALAGLLSIMAAGAMGQGAVDKKDPPGEIPRVMAYEGYLTDPSGKPIADGKYDFMFALYTSATGGTPVWTEEHRGVAVSGGIMRVLLGKGTVPRPLDLAFDREYFLGIRVGNDPEMSPRLELVTNAYSFRAIAADNVADGSITTEKLAPRAVTDDKIASVSWNKIIDAPDGDIKVMPGSDKPGAVPANVWHTRGNTKTDPGTDYVGTADSTDLLFKTNAAERMRIYSYGKIAMKGDLDVEGYVLSRKTPTEGGFHLGDKLHGLSRSGNDDVHMYTTGGGNLLLEGGNVGVGTSAPSALLHLNAAAGGSSPFKITDGAENRVVVESTGKITVSSSVSGAENLIGSYPFLLDAVNQGMAIKLDGSTYSPNNFVSFWDDRGMRGRIEGYNSDDVLADPEYYLSTSLDAIDIAACVIQLVGASSSSTACVGLGACVTTPIPSLIVAAVASLAAQTGRTILTQNYYWGNLGVNFQSGAGDYAEWLERLDEREKIEPGDIVGVFGGKVTRATDGAQQLLAISRAPIVLGNMPEAGKESLYEKAAFVGQVPVKVIGPVHEGDYVIPSGLKDGTGFAVSPQLMTADEFAKVVGRSWGSSESEHVKYINVAIGLNSGDIATIVKKQQAEIEMLRAELAKGGRNVEDARSELRQMKVRLASLDDLFREVARLRDEVAGLGGSTSTVTAQAARGSDLVTAPNETKPRASGFAK